MKNKIKFCFVIVLIYSSFLVSCNKDAGVADNPLFKKASVHENSVSEKKGNVNVAVTEFTANIAYPRGLKFGPDGNLYIALAGIGGTNSTVGLCGEDVLPMVQSLNGNTGKIIKVSPDGITSTVVDNFVDNLSFPTAMTFGPDGALYISNTGFGPPTGQILKVVFNSI